MDSRLQYSEASFLAELPDPGSLCRGSHRNRLLRGVQRRLRVSAGCSTRAKRRNRNGRDSNCHWMKVQWQVTSGEIDTEAKRKKLLEAYAEELSVKQLEWQDIQVSLVAGAGFEPAAF